MFATAAWYRLRALPLLEPECGGWRGGFHPSRPSELDRAGRSHTESRDRPGAPAGATWLRRNMWRWSGMKDAWLSLLHAVLPSAPPSGSLPALGTRSGLGRWMPSRLTPAAGGRDASAALRPDTAVLGVVSASSALSDVDDVGRLRLPERRVVCARCELRGLVTTPPEGAFAELRRLTACMEVREGLEERGVRGVGGLGVIGTRTAWGCVARRRYSAKRAAAMAIATATVHTSGSGNLPGLTGTSCWERPGPVTSKRLLRWTLRCRLRAAGVHAWGGHAERLW